MSNPMTFFEFILSRTEEPSTDPSSRDCLIPFLRKLRKDSQFHAVQSRLDFVDFMKAKSFCSSCLEQADKLWSEFEQTRDSLDQAESESRRARAVYEFILDRIRQVHCDCSDLYDLPAEKIARACVVLLLENYDIDHPANIAFLANQPDATVTEADVAGFMGSLCAEWLRIGRPGPDKLELDAHCEVNAARMIHDKKYAKLFPTL